MSQSYAETLRPRFDVHQAPDAAQRERANCPEIRDVHDLLHDLRQPLEVIDSLAFYLEMVSTDEHVVRHLQTIRTMAGRVNQIMDEQLTPSRHH